MSELISATDAAAYGAKLSAVQAMPHFPEPLSLNIAKKISEINESMDIFEVDSQSSAVASSIGSVLAEKRTFTTFSVPHAMHEFYTASFMRLPLVAACVSRGLGAYTIKAEHSVFLLRDAGWIIFLAESNQEIMDSIIMAYRISEKALLPSVVNIDGIPNFREPVLVPTEKKIGNFLPKLKMGAAKTVGAPVGDEYMEMRASQHKAMKNAAGVIKNVQDKWDEKFKRLYPTVEKYMMDDAEYALVVAGFHSSTGKAAVNRLREQGEKAGLLRIRVLRPFPEDEIKEALQQIKKAGVVDQSVSPGATGQLYTEIRPLCNAASFTSIGRHISEKDFIDMFSALKTEGKERFWVM
ncbi:MAG: hypothetical protein HYT72_01005 [Candidatus Aenigmarchaeota archaeon]|nr:hypothetical protein [Candidatus Aenigmarchaeota archaeon]